jgi:hypothetical protein
MTWSEYEERYGETKADHVGDRIRCECRRDPGTGALDVCDWCAASEEDE